MVGGHNINLRPTQVAGLGLGPDALTITSTTNLTSNVTVPQGQNTTVTAVAYVTTGPSAEPSTGPSAETFTAGQMAGVSAGVGVPLLLALLGAVLVITGQRRQLRAIRGTDVHHTVPPRRATGNEHYQDIAQQQQHLYNGHYPGAMPDSSPAKYMQTPDYNAHQPIMRELDNGSQRQEMDAGHPTRELETAQGGNYVGHLKQ